MKDYIDNYREAYDREFLEEGDEDIRKEFWKSARIEINRGKRKGLIQDCCLQDYIESNYRSYTQIPDAMRSTIEQCHFIPATLLADHFKVSVSAVRQIRANHNKK